MNMRMSDTPHVRLSDAKAFALLSANARRHIRAHGWVRCLREPNAWHAAEPTTPSDFGNGREPHAGPCRCRAKGRA